MAMLLIQGVELFKRGLACPMIAAFEAGQVVLPHLIKKCVCGKVQLVQQGARQTQIRQPLLPVGMALPVLGFQIAQALHQIRGCA